MDGGLCMGDNYFLLTNLLSEDERKVITSITAHIERGEKRAGIQQIAAENYLSTASIIKMCKRLGFDGYSELYYHLSRQLTGTDKRTEDTLGSFVDNYSDALVSSFCELLRARRKGKIFTTGEGFSNIVGTYIVQRMSICGFMAFSNVHFYDYMIFQEAQQSADADENDIMFAVSQSGENGAGFKRRTACEAARAEDHLLHAPQRLHARAALRSCLCRRRSEADAGGQPSKPVFWAHHPDL